MEIAVGRDTAKFSVYLISTGTTYNSYGSYAIYYNGKEILIDIYEEEYADGYFSLVAYLIKF